MLINVSLKYASVFPSERQENLEKIYRYSMFEVMFYRPDLWPHSHRVSWIMEDLIPVAKNVFRNFDGEKAALIGFIHDDAEIITGDHSAAHKAKMTKKEMRMIDKNEVRATKILSKKYPAAVGKYRCKNLLFEAVYHKTIEGQIADYADKLDAYFECLHEVLGGNFSFIHPLEFMQKRILLFTEKYPRIIPFVRNQKLPTLALHQIIQTGPHFINSKNYTHFGKPHTLRTIKLPTDFPFYDHWRDLTIKHWGKRGIDALIKQKEFLA